MSRDEEDATTKYLRPENPDFCCLPPGMMHPAQTKRREYKSTTARLCASCPMMKDCARERARGECQLLLHYFMAS